MKRIPITEASASQLADFAATNLGLDVQYRMGADKIRAVMATSGYHKDHIDVGEVQLLDPVPAPVVETKPREMVTIRIDNQLGAGGKDHVPVGVNGKVYRIKRGMDVAVPKEVVEVLKNANTVAYERGPNGEPINPSYVPKHPYSIRVA